MGNELEERREDVVRVLRVIEYTGPRSAVEGVIQRSIQGQKTFTPKNPPAGLGGAIFVHDPREPHLPVTIRATTLGTFPEILEAAVLEQALRGEPTEKDLRIAELERELEAERKASSYKYQKQAGQMQNVQVSNQLFWNAQNSAQQMLGSSALDLRLDDVLTELEASADTNPDPGFLPRIKKALGL